MPHGAEKISFQCSRRHADDGPGLCVLQGGVGSLFVGGCSASGPVAPLKARWPQGVRDPAGCPEALKAQPEPCLPCSLGLVVLRGPCARGKAGESLPSWIG